MNYRQVHFVGIKGTGMSALAQILVANGVHVTGSDVSERFPTDAALAQAGIKPLVGFAPENVGSPDLVVVSAAYGADNPELAEAQRRRIPVVSYPEFLAELVRGKRGIAVAGTHGKTTTTALIGRVLQEAGLDPQAVIGSGQALAGRGEFLVVESCEYRRHFLNYDAEIAVVTSVEMDHPDYFRDLNDVQRAFEEFAARLNPDGLLVVCGDDPRARALSTAARKVTYGFGGANDFRAGDLETVNGTTAFTVWQHGRELGRFALHIPGRHNVLNSLAAICIATYLGIEPESIARALRGFYGVSRRFEYKGTYRGALIYDDYAHHPTEVETTIRGAREWFPDRRLRVAFQPHTYSRTRSLLREFADSLSQADFVILASIFASAREQSGAGVSSEDICRLMPGYPETVKYLPTYEMIEEYLAGELGERDLLLTMGAGNLYKVAEALANRGR
ncbi:MAG: UDP-N-acetylmuramate--L-alanine ligase [Bacillota bacterium]